MAITIVDYGSVSPLGSTLDFQAEGITYPIENDVIMVTYFSNATSDLNFGMTGYDKIVDVYANDTGDTNILVFVKRVGSVPDTTIDVPAANGTDASCHVTILRGVDTINMLDVPVTTNTTLNTATIDPPAITPVTIGARVIGVMAASDNNAGYTSFNYTTSTSPPFSALLSASGGSTSGPVFARRVRDYGDWTSGTVNPTADVAGNTTANASNASAMIAFRPAPTGKIKVWNGSQWVAKPVKVWNGSAWVEKPVKTRSATAWVTTKY